MELSVVAKNLPEEGKKGKQPCFHSGSLPGEWWVLRFHYGVLLLDCGIVEEG
jgi:hypothetical protein